MLLLTQASRVAELWGCLAWVAKLRLAVATDSPERKALRSLWQTELATPLCHNISRMSTEF